MSIVIISKESSRRRPFLYFHSACRPGAAQFRAQNYQEVIGGQCRERCFSVLQAPQAQNSLRLALLDTSLIEGGYFCTAGSAVHSAGKRAAPLACGCYRGCVGHGYHPCRPRGERCVVAVGWLVNRRANTVRPYLLAKKTSGRMACCRGGMHACLPYGAAPVNCR